MTLLLMPGEEISLLFPVKWDYVAFTVNILLDLAVEDVRSFSHQNCWESIRQHKIWQSVIYVARVITYHTLPRTSSSHSASRRAVQMSVKNIGQWQQKQ
jgi:hypothetical protein